MKRAWTEEELVERWTLFSDELALIGARTNHTRLGFAVMAPPPSFSHTVRPPGAADLREPVFGLDG